MLTYGASARGAQEFKKMIMQEFPIGSHVVLYGGAEGDILFHTAGMHGEVDGLRIDLDDGTVQDVHYDDVEQVSWTDEDGFFHIESGDASVVILPEE